MVLLLESLEHVQQKQRLLHKLRQVARTLVLRTSCIPALSQGQHVLVFSGSMSLTSCTDVEKAVRAAGWQLTVPPRLWGADEAAHTIRYWRGRLAAANASLVHGSPDKDVLHASIESILAPGDHHADAPSSAYWSDGHHRLIDIVAENPVQASKDTATCPNMPRSDAPGNCSEKACIVSGDATEHALSALRRLLAAPWLSDGQNADDEAIRRALPAEDEAIIGQLMELHEGKVPETAVGISAKVTGWVSNLGQQACACASHVRRFAASVASCSLRCQHAGLGAARSRPRRR